MATLTIELPPRAEQTEFNLRRWAELLDDPELAKTDWRIETDRHGQIIMSPPPAPMHGIFQSEIAHLLRTLLPHARSITECPISTPDGVKAAEGVAPAFGEDGPEKHCAAGENYCGRTFGKSGEAKKKAEEEGGKGG